MRDLIERFEKDTGDVGEWWLKNHSFFKWIDKNFPRWHNPADKLPEHGQVILAKVGIGYQTTKYNENGFWFGSDGQYLTKQIIKWMEIPE
jgi:hypothetical protein